MTQRDIVIVLATLAVAVGLSAILFVGAAVTARTAAPEAIARPRVFFDSSSNLPPGLTVVDAQRRVAGPLQAIVPLQRGISDTARDAAGLFLTLLLTASSSCTGILWPLRSCSIRATRCCNCARCWLNTATSRMID